MFDDFDFFIAASRAALAPPLRLMADEDGGDAAAQEALFAAQMQMRSAAVADALRGARPAEALRLALQDAPLASKDAALKQANFDLVLRALQAAAQREEQLAAFFEQCDADSADVLMKYLYRGLRAPDNAALLLRLHAQLLEKAGVGCITRAIVDRKTA